MPKSVRGHPSGARPNDRRPNVNQRNFKRRPAKSHLRSHSGAARNGRQQFRPHHGSHGETKAPEGTLPTFGNLKGLQK